MRYVDKLLIFDEGKSYQEHVDWFLRKYPVLVNQLESLSEIDSTLWDFMVLDAMAYVWFKDGLDNRFFEKVIWKDSVASVYFPTRVSGKCLLPKDYCERVHKCLYPQTYGIILRGATPEQQQALDNELRENGGLPFRELVKALFTDLHVEESINSKHPDQCFFTGESVGPLGKRYRSFLNSVLNLPVSEKVYSFSLEFDQYMVGVASWEYLPLRVQRSMLKDVLPFVTDNRDTFESVCCKVYSKYQGDPETLVGLFKESMTSE